MSDTQTNKERYEELVKALEYQGWHKDAEFDYGEPHHPYTLQRFRKDGIEGMIKLNFNKQDDEYTIEIRMEDRFSFEYSISDTVTPFYGKDRFIQFFKGSLDREFIHIDLQECDVYFNYHSSERHYE